MDFKGCEGCEAPSPLLLGRGAWRSSQLSGAGKPLVESALGPVGSPRVRVCVGIKDTQPHLDHKMSHLETSLQAASLS